MYERRANSCKWKNFARERNFFYNSGVTYDRSTSAAKSGRKQVPSQKSREKKDRINRLLAPEHNDEDHVKNHKVESGVQHRPNESEDAIFVLHFQLRPNHPDEQFPVPPQINDPGTQTTLRGYHPQRRCRCTHIRTRCKCLMAKKEHFIGIFAHLPPQSRLNTMTMEAELRGSGVEFRVAIDATPLIGARTGIGECVKHTIGAVQEQGVSLQPFTLSYRARRNASDLPANNIFVRTPARILLPLWAHVGRPFIDRKLPRVDLVHATNYLSPPTRHPLLVTVQDCTFARFPENLTRTMRWYEQTLKRAMRNDAWIHVTTNFSAHEVREIFQNDVDTKRIRVATLGIPELPNPQSSPLASGSPYVLSVSTLEPRKNYPRLIEAFANAKLDDTRLIIVGSDGLDRKNVDDTIAKLPSPIAQRVVLAGRLPGAEVADLMNRTIGLAYPSLYEGFGFPMLQAMQKGIPVLAGDGGALPEVAGEAALLVDPNNSANITAGLESLVDDTALRENLIKRGKERAEEFTWKKAARQLIDIYEEML